MERQNGVVIEARLRTDSDVSDEVAGSGFVVNTNTGVLVISSASWISPILQSKIKGERNLQEISYYLEKSVLFYIIFNNGQHLETHNAVFVRVVDVPEAGTLFQRYFVKGSNTQWSDSLDGIEPLVRLMPVVLVLKFKSPPYLRSFRPMTTGKELAVGDQVCVDATPLSNICPDIFIHSTIYGHICGCYGNSNALFIVDAPCPVGCEGGAVLLLRGWTTEKPHPLFSLAGMVVCPVLLKDGALSGIGLAITMEHIAKSLEKEMGISLVNTPYPKSLAFNPKQRMSVEEFSLFVCGVVAGATWGTGIILSPNLILTCSHVVEGMSSVVIVQENGRHQRASVVYSTKPSCAMDVAVISASQSLRCVDKVKWRGSSCLKGDRVAIVGCGLHNPLTKANAGPLVTFGHISNILYQEDNPVMYHVGVFMYICTYMNLMCSAIHTDNCTSYSRM
jgi:hypothetical protein